MIGFCVGLSIGAMIGVGIMCLLQINREDGMAPKHKENPRYAVISTRLDDATYAWVSKLARENDSTIAAVVEAMIQQVRSMACK